MNSFFFSVSTASPCVWNVCVTRKAPLVASDSSSSGGSDSEEEEDKADTVTETISTGSGQETIKLTVDAKNEKAVFSRCGRNVPGPGAGSAPRLAGLGALLLPVRHRRPKCPA